MRVLMVHNRYLQAGGEDRVFEEESGLLERHGHDVLRFEASNVELQRHGRLGQGLLTLWNRGAYADVRAQVRRFRPDVVHFHNTFPLLSPAVFHAARAGGAAVVETLHNYRLACPDSLLFRDGRVCEECLGARVPWPAVRHGCYRSRAASCGVVAMLALHRALGTWDRAVDRHIVLTEFARRKFVEAGLPPERLVLKPNFVGRDLGVGAHAGGFALFVGRLAPEKGVDVLLEAWRRVGERLPLKVVGVGQLEGGLRPPPPGVEWLGFRPADEVFALMRDATVLVFPSVWYETFGLTIIEAFATGLPVLASRLGTAAELVDDGSTGRHFEAGSAASLAEAVAWTLAHPGELAAMGRRGRARYEARYTAARNYELLLSVYAAAMEAAGRRAPLHGPADRAAGDVRGSRRQREGRAASGSRPAAAR
jgi:glycosyltransferase involved in cell wall biosynthesis